MSNQERIKKREIKIQPIRPESIISNHRLVTEDDIVNAVNLILAERFNSQWGYCVIYRRDISRFISDTQKDIKLSSSVVNYTDIRKIFTEAGWLVDYLDDGGIEFSVLEG